MEELLLSLVSRRLSEYSLELEGAPTLESVVPEEPVTLTVLHPHGSQRVSALLTSTPTLTRALRAQTETHGQRLFLLGPVVHPRSAHDLRAAGIQFLDAAGNAYLDFAGVFIDVRGRRPDPAITFRESNPGRAANLFAPRRAQVIFALLSWPALAEASVRTIAAAAKVSVGQTQSTLRLLDEQDLYDPRSGRLLRRDALAERWAETFFSGLGPKTRLRQFHGDPSRLVLEGHGEVYVSGEQAASWIRDPATATLYVDDLDPRLALVNRWRSDGDHNILVRRTFWAHPGDSQPPSFPAPAPPLLVYADLMGTHGPRQLQAAQKLKEDHAELWGS